MMRISQEVEVIQLVSVFEDITLDLRAVGPCDEVFEIPVHRFVSRVPRQTRLVQRSQADLITLDSVLNEGG